MHIFVLLLRCHRLELGRGFVRLPLHDYYFFGSPPMATTAVTLADATAAHTGVIILVASSRTTAR